MASPNRTIAKETTQDRIVGAAIELFSQHGFHGTSVRDIAQRAALNEVTVFRYFPRKRDLFLAAVESSVRRIELPEELRRKLRCVDHPRVVIGDIVDFLIGVSVQHSDVLRLLSFAALETQSAATLLCKSLRPVGDLSAYLCSCMKKGIIREVDPEATAMALAATAMTQFSCETDGQGRAGPVRQQLVDSCTTVLLRGLLADPECTTGAQPFRSHE